MPNTRTTKVRSVAIQIRVSPDDVRRLDRFRGVIGLSRAAALRAALRFFLTSTEAKTP
jgi:hypothetical protein